MSAPEKKLDELFPDSDDEWEAMMRGMSDDELVKYLRNVYETLSSDTESLPDTITPELLEQIRSGADKFEVTVRRARIAEQNAAIAKAAVERTADALLASLPDKKKGH